MRQLQRDKLLVVDIETVRRWEHWADMPERMQAQWVRKAGFLPNPDALDAGELYEDRGGIYSEWGQVVAIGMGFFTMDEGGTWSLRVKGLSGTDEAQLLVEFSQTLERFATDLKLVAHNGIEFDFPYLARRMLVNGLPIPQLLDMRGFKPWEVPHIDTMELWKFGDRKAYTSLDLLAALFGIDSSKEDIDGSQVSQVYYTEGSEGLERISQYCQRDVVVTAQLLLKLVGEEPIAQENVVWA